MNLFGVEIDRAQAALLRLRPDPAAEAEGDAGAEPSWMPEAFAAAAWSGIAEPADRIAGLLIEAIGAAGALTALIERWSPQRILDRIAERAASGAAPDAASVDCTPEQLGDALARWSPRLSAAGILRGIEQGARAGARLLLPSDPQWPAGLRDLGHHAPAVLWVRGELSAVAPANAIALVGARAATGYGEHVAAEFAGGLVERGYTVTSGAAYGIDGMAHRAALAGGGRTVAFLAGGVDRSYPSGHEQLLSRIAESGAVCAETLPGTAPSKWRFLMRNRIIAASTLLTVVIEAGWRSGSLNTAGHAASLGRTVAAVPGPVTSPASAGCHRLIREYGAQLVSTTAELLELLPERAAAAQGEEPGAGPATAQPGAGGAGQRLPAEQLRLLDALSTRQGRSIEELCRRSGLSPAQARGALGALDALGRVGQAGDGGWRRLASTR